MGVSATLSLTSAWPRNAHTIYNAAYTYSAPVIYGEARALLITGAGPFSAIRMPLT